MIEYFLNKKQNAFTLIELLVVIAVISLLSTLAIAAVNRARNSAKTTKARHDIAEIYKAIEMLAGDTGQWPGHQEAEAVGGGSNNEICGDGCAHNLSSGFAGLTKDDPDLLNPFPNWSGPYMEKIPLDPWGNEYFFDTDYSINSNDQPCNGGGGCVSAAVVGSYGPDGIGNNQYNSDDIIKIIIK